MGGKAEAYSTCALMGISRTVLLSHMLCAGRRWYATFVDVFHEPSFGINSVKGYLGLKAMAQSKTTHTFV